jgi:CubicO group peptidase (beta-lactamase class C family)
MVQRQWRMRLMPGLLAMVTSFVSACGSSRSEKMPVTPKPSDVSRPSGSPAAPVEAALTFEVLRADTPRTTAQGTSFVAPKDWKIAVRGAVTLLELPEAGSRIALVDVDAKDADAAVEAAWAAYGVPARKLKMSSDRANREGWHDTRFYFYETSPNERRDVFAGARRSSGERWTVLIEDVSVDAIATRFAQRELIYSSLLPKGFERESFAGKKARRLGPAEIAELKRFVTTAQSELGVPGISMGVVQDGKVAFAGGFGVRELGKKAPVDENTLFMIASQTKPLTTLMLAKLVEEGRFSWDTSVAALYPTFRLGNAETTASIRVKNLICACTGIPRKDWSIIEFQGSTPQQKLDELARFTPTTKLGEMFQYSDQLVAAAGFVGGHVAYPEFELGAAYDKAMQSRVFGPLGMTATTLDHRLALRRTNRATAHTPDRDGKQALATMELNENIIAARPAGGGWSNVRDMLKYVQMELANGRLPDGKRYVAEEPLLARRAPQVPIDEYLSYGLGLFVERRYGIHAVYHGGNVVGYHSGMLWLPEHGVGAVVLTNGDPAWSLMRAFRRKLLELLFDGRPEADEWISTMAKSFYAELVEKRKLVTLPADAADAAKLAPRYANDELGEIAVRHDGPAVVFDFGEWKGEVASSRNPDGSVSFRAVDAGIWGFMLEFVTGDGPKRTLKLREGQHEYTFTEK